MANLAIKGHPTRGKEVIQLLEMLGGIAAETKGFRESYCYYISEDTATKYISWDYIGSEEIEKYKIFTLEEFLEKYPYKVGDKVKNRYGSSGKVYQMKWIDDEIQYRLDFGHHTSGWYSAENLQPYKEESMEGKVTFNESEGTLVAIDLTRELRIADEVEVILGDYEFVLKDGKTYFVKKNKYPKTYEECCKILMGKTDFQDFELVLTRYAITRSEENSISPCPPHISLINNFYKLLICRDAYWKIAGEQMGLDTPWKPDWNNQDDCYHAIKTCKNESCLVSTLYLEDCILAFPTEEMRDEFYKNFKELIEQCKELL